MGSAQLFYLPVLHLVAVILFACVVLALFDIARALERSAGTLEVIQIVAEKAEHSVEHIRVRLGQMSDEISRANRIQSDWHLALGRSGKGPL